MKSFKAAIAGVVCGIVLLLVVAWTPTHTSFNTNQFATTGFRVSIKDGALLTNPVFFASINVPNAASVTTDVFGELAADNNAWASGRGALQFFDGTANTFILGVLATDTPVNGQVPKINNGVITWEDDGGGAGGDVVTLSTAQTVTGAKAFNSVDLIRSPSRALTSSNPFLTVTQSWDGIGEFVGQQLSYSAADAVSPASAILKIIWDDTEPGGSTLVDILQYTNQTSGNVWRLLDDGSTLQSGSLTVNGPQTNKNTVYIMGSPSTTSGRFTLLTTNQQQGLTFSAPDAQTNSWNVVWPTNMPTANQILAVQSITGTNIALTWAADATGGGGGAVTTNYWITADQGTTSGTAVNVTDAVFAIAANETWTVEFRLGMTIVAGGDPKFALDVPTGATVGATVFAFSGSGGADLELITADATLTGTTFIGTPGVVTISATIQNSSTAGNVQLQFASGNGSSTATVKGDQSYWVARRNPL